MIAQGMPWQCTMNFHTLVPQEWFIYEASIGRDGMFLFFQDYNLFSFFSYIDSKLMKWEVLRKKYSNTSTISFVAHGDKTPSINDTNYVIKQDIHKAATATQ